MTQRAGVQSLLTGKTCGIDNISGGCFSGIRGMKSYVLGARPVTFFAVDSKHDLALVEKVPISCIPAEHSAGIGGMTFQTLCGDASVIQR